MTVLDVRQKQDEYDEIRFSEIGSVLNNKDDERINIRIFTTSNSIQVDDNSIVIKGEEEAQDLIKALETAIDMGWLESDGDV